VRFKLHESEHRGLKIPTSAIINRTFLMIPQEYIDINSRITKRTGERDEHITVRPFRSGTDEDEGYIYVTLDITRLGLGDMLVRPGLPPYIISRTVSIKGIFTANNGVTRFREIREESPITSGGYCLLNPVKNPGIRTHDLIIIDASSVLENQILY